MDKAEKRTSSIVLNMGLLMTLFPVCLPHLRAIATDMELRGLTTSPMPGIGWRANTILTTAV